MAADAHGSVLPTALLPAAPPTLAPPTLAPPAQRWQSSEADCISSSARGRVHSAHRAFLRPPMTPSAAHCLPPSPMSFEEAVTEVPPAVTE